MITVLFPVDSTLSCRLEEVACKLFNFSMHKVNQKVVKFFSHPHLTTEESQSHGLSGTLKALRAPVLHGCNLSIR